MASSKIKDAANAWLTNKDAGQDAIKAKNRERVLESDCHFGTSLNCGVLQRQEERRPLNGVLNSRTPLVTPCCRVDKEIRKLIAELQK